MYCCTKDWLLCFLFKYPIHRFWEVSTNTWERHDTVRPLTSTAVSASYQWKSLLIFKDVAYYQSSSSSSYSSTLRPQLRSRSFVRRIIERVCTKEYRNGNAHTHRGGRQEAGDVRSKSCPTIAWPIGPRYQSLWWAPCLRLSASFVKEGTLHCLTLCFRLLP